jgi:hypothetical protein
MQRDSFDLVAMTFAADETAKDLLGRRCSGKIDRNYGDYCR